MCISANPFKAISRLLDPLTRFTGEFLRFRNHHRLLPAPGFVWLYLFTGSSRATTEYRGITFVNPDWSRRRFCHCACFIGETSRWPVCTCTRMRAECIVHRPTEFGLSEHHHIDAIRTTVSCRGNNAMCTMSVRKMELLEQRSDICFKKLLLRNNFIAYNYSYILIN